MKPNQIIFLTFSLLIIGFLTYKFSFSYFSDSAQSTNNILSASATFPTASPTVTNTPTPTPGINHLIINEVSSFDDFKKDWIELYNPTGSTISVFNFQIEDNNGIDDLPNVSIPAGGYGVIKGNASSTVIIPGSATTIEITNSKIGGDALDDAGDKIILRDATVSHNIIDQMSYGTDPSGIFPTPPLAPGSGQSLTRSPNGTDTNTAADWVVNSSPSIGVAN